MSSFTDFRTRQGIVTAGIVGTKAFNKQKGNWKLSLTGLFPASSQQKGLIQTRRDLSDQIRALAESVAPATTAAFDRHLLPVAEAAFDNWPVRSGLSKTLIEFNWTTSGDGLEFGATLTNSAPYSWFITSPQKEGRSSVVRELIFTPGEKAAVLIAEEIGRAVAAGS